MICNKKYLNFMLSKGFVFMPFFIFLSIWSYEVSVMKIAIEFGIAMSFAVYIIVIGSLSPCKNQLYLNYLAQLIFYNLVYLYPSRPTTA